MHKLSQLEAFVCVVERGSFSQAAEYLGISAAAVSKNIASLEQQMQCQLIQRTTRKLSLTNLGERYFQQCKQIIELIQESEKMLATATHTPRGKLKLFLMNAQFFIPYVQQFQQQYPELQLKIEIAERLPNFVQEGIDILIGASYHHDDNLVRVKIGRTHYRFYASPSYLAKHGVPLQIEDLLHHRYLEHTARFEAEQGNILFQNGQYLRLQPTLLINNMDALINCSTQGLGIVRSHYEYAKQYLEQGLLLEVLPDAFPQESNVYLYYPYSRYTEPKIRAVVDFVTANNIGHVL